MGNDGDPDDSTAANARGPIPKPDGPSSEDLATVVSVLNDQYTREILVSTTDRALSAEQLIEQSDASRPTIYRRLRRLVDLDLLVERQELDPNGHHFKTYRARLDRVTIDLDADGFTTRVARSTVEDDAVGRLNRLYERLQG